jgi:hypothetical protein
MNIFRTFSLTAAVAASLALTGCASPYAGALSPYADALKDARDRCYQTHDVDSPACEAMMPILKADTAWQHEHQRNLDKAAAAITLLERQRNIGNGLIEAGAALQNAAAIMAASRPVPPRVVFAPPDPPSGPTNCSGTVGPLGNFTAHCW